MTDTRQVATGASFGAIANPEHARIAVNKAKQKLGEAPVASVILFLSGAYAHEPQAAIKEAVKAAGTPLIFGGCAQGVMTEQDWVIDAEGAVAMVFSPELALQPASTMQQLEQSTQLALSVCSPNASNMALGALPHPQFGAEVSDQFGHGPFSVWQGGRIAEREYIYAGFPPHLDYRVQVADGIRALSPIMQIKQCDEHRLFEIDQSLAVDNLLGHLPETMRKRALDQPYTLLAAVSNGQDKRHIQAGEYQLHHVIATKSGQDGRQEIQLSGEVANGNHLFWAVRDPSLAEVVMAKKLAQSKEQLGAPLFGIMFSNIGRGPEFYEGRDRDHEQFIEAFPGTPLIGFYSNGEIAPGIGVSNMVHRYSNSFALFV